MYSNERTVLNSIKAITVNTVNARKKTIYKNNKKKKLTYLLKQIQNKNQQSKQ